MTSSADSFPSICEKVNMAGQGSRVKKSCHFCKRYTDHLDGKMKCFLLHMSANYRDSMIIPHRFMNQFGGEIYDSIDIESPDGSVYGVKVSKHMNKTVPQCGWKAFINANFINENDSLLFRHIENSCFKVLILDPDGCEKVFPCAGIKITSIIKERETDCVEISDSSNDCTKTLSRVRKRLSSSQRNSPSQRRKAARVTTAASSSDKSGEDSEGIADHESSFGLDEPQTNAGPDYVLSRLSYLSEEQEQEVVELIKEIKPDVPVFVAIMKQSNVKSQCPYLGISKDYAAAHFPHKTQIVTLQRPGKNKKWHPNFYIRTDRSTYMFVGRWVDFVQENHVQEGDICIFEPVKSAGTKFTVRVHLIRESKFHTIRENGNSPGGVSCSRGKTRTKVNGPIIVNPSCEGRGKEKATLTAHVKEESLESEDSGGPYKAFYILSSHAHLTGDQKTKVEERVRSIQSEVPIYVAVMNKTSVAATSSCSLFLGKRYVTKYLPAGEQTLTLLRQGKNTAWKVKMRPRRCDAHAQMLTTGWRDFVHDNRLQLDDICLFQLTKDAKGLTMTVYIMRHRKHY